MDEPVVQESTVSLPGLSLETASQFLARLTSSRLPSVVFIVHKQLLS